MTETSETSETLIYPRDAVKIREAIDAALPSGAYVVDGNLPGGFWERSNHKSIDRDLMVYYPTGINRPDGKPDAMQVVTGFIGNSFMPQDIRDRAIANSNWRGLRLVDFARSDAAPKTMEGRAAFNVAMAKDLDADPRMVKYE